MALAPKSKSAGMPFSQKQIGEKMTSDQALQIIAHLQSISNILIIMVGMLGLCIGYLIFGPNEG